MTSFSAESVDRITRALVGVLADQDAEVQAFRKRSMDHSCAWTDRQIAKLTAYLARQEELGCLFVPIAIVAEIFATDPADD